MKYYQNRNKSVFKLDFHDNGIFDKLKKDGVFFSSLMEIKESADKLYKVTKSRTGFQVFNEKSRTIKQVDPAKLIEVIQAY